MGGLSKKIDIPCLWYPTISQLLNNELSLQDVVSENKSKFRAKLIKEPNLAFVTQQLNDVFPEAKLVFVVRDPFSNMKSILDRLGLSAGFRLEDKIETFPSSWAHVFDNQLWRFPCCDPTLMLAHRWKLVAKNALSISGNVMHVSYSDFQADKLGCLRRISQNLGISEVNNVAKRLNVKYQPGGNHKVSIGEFFGTKIIDRITEICEPEFSQLGYQVLKSTRRE